MQGTVTSTEAQQQLRETLSACTAGIQSPISHVCAYVSRGQTCLLGTYEIEKKVGCSQETSVFLIALNPHGMCSLLAKSIVDCFVQWVVCLSACRTCSAVKHGQILDLYSPYLYGIFDNDGLGHAGANILQHNL